jgi:hypothetical protein
MVGKEIAKEKKSKKRYREKTIGKKALCCENVIFSKFRGLRTEG